MNVIDIIEKKKKREILTKEEIAYVINAYMRGEVKDYQVSALLMSICLNGMNEQEAINLTSVMLNSGEILDLSSIAGVKVDKHSTGGVGDKTTLVVAPLVAACGLIVPKMSGRGLGHTGGTIDKLEAIKGFDVNVNNEDFLNQLKEIGVAITTSSLNIAPADKKLYALRDVTSTVDSIPLIASSIMSKKLAINADKIVLDVKVGKGAFANDLGEAKALANLMVKIGKSFNKETIALITNMDYPLGKNIGNGLEIKEAIDTLNGKGEKRFTDLCIAIASYMVSIGKNIDVDSAKEEVIVNLNDGKAYEKFISMVNYQAGDINDIDIAPIILEYNASKSGYLNTIDTLELGKYVMRMGAGRETKEDAIDYGVGLILNCVQGQYVNSGDVIATLYLRDKEIDLKQLDSIFIIEANQQPVEPLVYKIIK